MQLNREVLSMGRLRKFLRLSASDRRLLLEAVVALAVARALIVLLPFRWIAPRLGRFMAAAEALPMARAAEPVRRVGWAVRTAARHVPWNAVCLPQAMAGKAMLNRRGVASTLYLGVARDEAAGLAAHAWLKAGDAIVTGATGMQRFTVVGTFG